MQNSNWLTALLIAAGCGVLGCGNGSGDGINGDQSSLNQAAHSHGTDGGAARHDDSDDGDHDADNDEQHVTGVGTCGAKGDAGVENDKDDDDKDDESDEAKTTGDGGSASGKKDREPAKDGGISSKDDDGDDEDNDEGHDAGSTGCTRPAAHDAGKPVSTDAGAPVLGSVRVPG